MSVITMPKVWAEVASPVAMAFVTVTLLPAPPLM